jgi:16S rRNA processing protein RimM
VGLSDPRKVVLGRLLGAHGVRGWLKVVSYTDPIENLLQHPTWLLAREGESGREYRVRDAEFDGRWLRVSLDGIEDRDAAEALRGLNIEVARAELAPAGPREYYRDDLLGFTVSNLAGVELGQVSHFVEAPAAAVMVVRGAREHWIPAAAPHLVKVQLGQHSIVVDWPEDF